MNNHLRRIICSLLSALMLFACVVIPSSFNSASSKISIVQSLEAEAATITYGRVIANDLNVRTGAGTNYKSLRKLDFDTPVYIYKTKNGWGKISSSKNEWVYLDYVESVSKATYQKLKKQYDRRQEFNPAITVEVCVRVLNVRYKPSTYYGDKLYTLKMGDRVKIYKTRYGLDSRVWGSLNSAGTKWICLVEDDADFVGIVG